jgi:PPOX class probable F420-dependent enzyme
MKLPSRTIDYVLGSWPIARLATTGPTGPHIVPVVFTHLAGSLWSPIDGKPKRGGQLMRVSNVLSDPRAALLFDAWHTDWSLLWWLRIDVVASVVTPITPLTRPASDAVAALQAKYPQYQHVPVLGEPPTLLRLTIEQTQSWCAGTAAIESIEAAPQ